MNIKTKVSVNFSKWKEIDPVDLPIEVFEGSFFQYKQYIENKIDWKPKKPKREINNRKCCDNCINYKWHNDWCERFLCEVDYRSVCSQYNIPVD